LAIKFSILSNFQFNQSFQKDQSNKPESDLTSQSNNNVEQEIASETQMLRTQMRLAESEKEKLLCKFKELQEENNDLKSKLITLKKNSSSFDEQNNNNCSDSSSMTVMRESHSSKPLAQLLTEKDFEIQRLQRIIEELLKSNQEKVCSVKTNFFQ